jgi:hypothetical protein
MVVGGNGVPNAIMMYENLALVAAAKDIDEAGYYDTIKAQYDSMPDYGFDDLGTKTATVAGATYTVGSASIADGLMLQDYYLRRQDGVMIVLCVTYTSDTADAAGELVAQFAKAK